MHEPCLKSENEMWVSAARLWPNIDNKRNCIFVVILKYTVCAVCTVCIVYTAYTVYTVYIVYTTLAQSIVNIDTNKYLGPIYCRYRYE